MMIVDDNPWDQEGLAGVLNWRSMGINVTAVCPNGKAALDAFDAAKPDIVLTDVAMPVMNGMEMAGRIREAHPDVKLIFMSCHNEFDFARTAIRLDAEDYILKPVVACQLQETVTRVLKKLDGERGERRKRDELDRQLRRYEEMRPAVPGCAENPQGPPDRGRALNARIVLDIKKAVAARYNEPVSVQEIAESVYLSTVHANNIFKSVTGKTIFEYLTEYRLEAAKTMLRDPYSRVYLVAEKAGYLNKSHFCMLFKKYTGMTPNEYRNGAVV